MLGYLRHELNLNFPPTIFFFTSAIFGCHLISQKSYFHYWLRGINFFTGMITYPVVVSGFIFLSCC